MVIRLATIVLFLILLTSVTSVTTAQMRAEAGKYSVLIENQLTCKSNPRAGKLLIELRRRGLISRTYVVSDSVSYFKLSKSIRVMGFDAIGVFGFQQGFPRFFVRGPGMAPPDMVGIIVRDSVAAAKRKLEDLGLENVRVEEHPYKLTGSINNSKSKLTEVMCWERF